MISKVKKVLKQKGEGKLDSKNKIQIYDELMKLIDWMFKGCQPCDFQSKKSSETEGRG